MKKISTKDRLLFAALEAATMTDFKSITVSDITNLAGVTKGSFYTYFTDKSDCYMQASKNLYQSVNKHIQSDILNNTLTPEIFAERLFEMNWNSKKLARVYATEVPSLNEKFSKEFQSHYKNTYKDILKIILKKDDDDILEMKAIIIMGLITALIFDVFACKSSNEEVIKEQFIRTTLLAIR